MISIIICSRKPNIPVELRENISDTIGCEYEIVVIDNSGNQYSIFSAYNEGVRRANGDILCFCHDDILFHTDQWGDIIRVQFSENDDIGLIGVAGSHFLSSAPLYWSHSPFISEHNLANDSGKAIEYFKDDYFDPKGLSEVVAVDGLCYFVRRKLFEIIQYDEQSYRGFHAYDMDICMQVHKLHYKICVSRKILVEHFWSESACATKKGYELLDKNLAIFSKKWQAYLPMHCGVNNIPSYVWERINSLSIAAYDATKARHSKSYRLGHAILHPLHKGKDK